MFPFRRAEAHRVVPADHLSFVPRAFRLARLPQAVSLLSYLIVHRSRPQTRDLLAGRFWAELPEDRARKRLSNCLWLIKSGLGEAGLPDLLSVSSTTIQFASPGPVEVDAVQRVEPLVPGDDGTFDLAPLLGEPA